jgi:hypothetical protein
MADITYWGLTSTKGTVTIADTSTATIDDLVKFMHQQGEKNDELEDIKRLSGAY